VFLSFISSLTVCRLEIDAGLKERPVQFGFIVRERIAVMRVLIFFSKKFGAEAIPDRTVAVAVPMTTRMCVPK
jgi:hypothetical protein